MKLLAVLTSLLLALASARTEKFVMGTFKPAKYQMSNYLQNAPDWEPTPREFDSLVANPGHLNQTQEELLDKLVVTAVPKRPRVLKFAESIYDQVYYSKSAMYDYIQAFYQGYGFQDYSFA